MGYTTEQLESIEVKMYELPKIERRKQQYNKKEAIKSLARAIASLRKRGYTLEQVADFLRGESLDITERTLRNYLQQHKRPAKKAPVKKEPAAQQTAATGASEPGEEDLDKHNFKGKI